MADIVAATAQRYREGEEVYWHDIVAAAAQRYTEGEEVYWHDIVAATAVCCNPLKKSFLL